MRVSAPPCPPTRLYCRVRSSPAQGGIGGGAGSRRASSPRQTGLCALRRHQGSGEAAAVLPLAPVGPGQLTSISIHVVVGITHVIPIKGVVIIIILLEELLLKENAAQAVLLLVDRGLVVGDMTGATHKVSKPGKKPQRRVLCT